jgi:membrane protein CcdC involved in cytochrome C biogenesis
MSNSLLVLLSIIEAVVLVLVLALALIRIRTRLQTVSRGLVVLAEVVGSVQKDLHLVPLAAPQLNEVLEAIVGALPSIASMAETLADGS